MFARRTLNVLLAFSALGAAAAQAQIGEPERGAGSDVFTINLYGGGYKPTSDLTSGSDFGGSGTVGGSATFWVHRYIGVRANVLYARTDASPEVPDPLEGESPNIWAYSGDLVLRMPFSDGRWFPYIVGGAGGKTYDFDLNDRETDFAGNFGGGVEYRFARWGIQAEVRDVVSKFERFGVDKTQHDIAWTAGITLSF